MGRPPQVELTANSSRWSSNRRLTSSRPIKTETVALNIIGDNLWQVEDLLRHGSCDASYGLSDLARFRVNVFAQRGNYSIVCRQLNSTIPTLEKLKFPDIFKEIPKEKTGLILVTGATGSGKSTSLAASSTKSTEPSRSTLSHWRTRLNTFIADQATFNQRELGIDFDSYVNGLRAALRQAPKVILVANCGTAKRCASP